MLGAATAVYMIPSKQIGVLVLTNGSPVGLPEAIALNFFDFFEYGAPRKDYLRILEQDYAALRQGVLDSSKDYSKEKPPSDPSPGGAASSFVDTYTNPYYGKVEIEEQQGKLILRLPPLGAYYELSHWDGNIYTYYIADEVSGAARGGVLRRPAESGKPRVRIQQRVPESPVTNSRVDLAAAPKRRRGTYSRQIRVPVPAVTRLCMLSPRSEVRGSISMP